MIISEVLGQLNQNHQFEDWWTSDKTPIPFWDGRLLSVTFMDFLPSEDITFIEEADAALKSFFQKNNSHRRQISELVLNEYYSYLRTVEVEKNTEANAQNKNTLDVWMSIIPTEILVTRRPYNDQDIYIVALCECDWDDEHGLQLVFRRGRQITRVSSQDGHLTEADADDKPDSEDKLLQKFIEET